MVKSRIKSRYRKSRKSRFCQGDILRDVSFVLRGSHFSDEQDEIFLRYAIVMSQECDLDHDDRARKEIKLLPRITDRAAEVELVKAHRKCFNKFLPTVLLCPAYLAEDFFAGTHITEWDMQEFDRGGKNKITKNDEYARFHYLPSDASAGTPALVIDFKHFFTIPREIVYKKRIQIYVTSLSELFREDISQRFSNFLSRIGLPEL